MRVLGDLAFRRMEKRPRNCQMADEQKGGQRVKQRRREIPKRRAPRWCGIGSSCAPAAASTPGTYGQQLRHGSPRAIHAPQRLSRIAHRQSVITLPGS